MSKPRVFVAGATGLTGRFLVEAFCARGVPTMAHIRPDSSRRDEWSARFTALGAEVSTAVWAVDDMHSALSEFGATLVYGCLGTTKKRAGRGDGDYEAVDYGLTVMLMDAASRMTTQPAFIYISAVGVSPDVTNAYLQVRAKVEARLEASDLTTLVVRPSFITGPRDDARPLETIGASVSDSLLAGLGVLGLKRWTGKFRTLTGQQLAQGIAQLGIDGFERDRIVFVPDIEKAQARWAISMGTQVTSESV
ncbi:MAG: NAD(P)H-binding protein [Myxococcota bacterium]|nr:NAD(P)H-binding protein [Myxococcota bacterium]